ncbi:hypothetical protein NS229_27775 [Methylobacterium indicum]|nr:hypothetical protein NS229_27775 [Methylobacterium indicum]
MDLARDERIDDARVEVRRQQARLDPGHAVHALDGIDLWPLARRDRSVGRLDRHHRHARLACLEETAGAGDRAAGPDRRDEDVDGTVRVTPDLGAGRVVVDAGIGRVGALVGVEGVGILAPHAVDDRVDTAGRQELRIVDRNGLGAVALDERNLLVARRGAQVELRPVAPGHGERREADSRIAACELDEELPRYQPALGLGGLDDAPGSAVLDAARRVQCLDLGQDAGPKASPLAEAPELEERRVADEGAEMVAWIVHDLSLDLSLSSLSPAVVGPQLASATTRPGCGRDHAAAQPSLGATRVATSARIWR